MTTLVFKRKTSSGRYPWAMIDRDDAARRARLERSHPELLALDVDFGLSVVQQALDRRASTRPTLTAMAVSLLFHRVVELLDAVDVLLSAGNALPARHMTRAMIEASIYVRWLSLIDDDKVAAVYLLVSHHESLRLASRGHHGDGPLPGGERREALSTFLDSLDDRRDWRKTYHEVVRARIDHAQWFSAFGGPRSLAEMLRNLGDEATEDVRFFLDAFELTSRSLDWPESVDLEESTDPVAVTGLLHPLRNVRFYSDTVAIVCHSNFVNALHAIIAYFGAEVDGVTEWSDAVSQMLDEPEE